MATQPPIQPELERAFAVALSILGVVADYVRGSAASVPIPAILAHPNQFDQKALGQSIILKVRLSDFAATALGEPLPGDIATIGPESYTLYLVTSDAVDFADLYLQHR